MSYVFSMLSQLTVSASVMIIIVIVIRILIAHRLSTKMLAYLWLLVILRLLIPFTIESPLHIDALFSAKTYVQDYEPESDSANWAANAINIYPYSIPADDLIVLPEKQTMETMVYGRLGNYIKSISFMDCVLIVWLAGIAFMVVWQIILIIGLYQKIVYSKCNKDRSLKAQGEEICKELKMKSIDIRKSRHVDVPIAVGILNPKVIIPVDLFEELTTKQLRLIIMHELCHIKRMDTQKNLLWLVAKIIYWFNPLVWIANKFILMIRKYSAMSRLRHI